MSNKKRELNPRISWKKSVFYDVLRMIFYLKIGFLCSILCEEFGEIDGFV